MLYRRLIPSIKIELGSICSAPRRNFPLGDYLSALIVRNRVDIFSQQALQLDRKGNLDISIKWPRELDGAQ
jgi:hypothetical protein